jgi:predicted homoserine dehydrogenase-like protein
MQFDFLEKVQEISKKTIQENNVELENSNISKTELELAKKLDAIQEFSVDRFEENIVVLEDKKNGDIVNVEKSKLPKDIKEGDILKCINGKYSLDKEKTIDETNRIKDKMNNLWN